MIGRRDSWGNRPAVLLCCALDGSHPLLCDGQRQRPRESDSRFGPRKA